MKHVCSASLAYLAVCTGLVLAAMTFDDYEALYREQESKITSQCEEKLSLLLQKYRQNLVAARDSWQRAGDLENVMAVGEELKRFDADKAVPGEPADDLPPVISKMQSEYHGAKNKLIETRDRMIVGLTRQYIARLNKLKKEYVIAGNIDEAARVNDEIKRTEFILADASSRLPAPGTGQTDKSGGGRASASRKKLPGKLEKGLVLQFDFSGKNGKTVPDRSAKNNDGIVRGAKWVKIDKDNGAYRFDGENDYIEVPNSASLAFPKIMTISMWIKLQGWENGGALCTKGTGDGGESWGLDMQGQRIRFYRWYPRRGRAPEVTTPAVSKDRWHHVVAVADGSVLRAYLDGSESTGASYSRPFLVNDHIVSIGSRQRGAGPYDLNVKGLIDDVMIWNRALSKEEVQQLRKATEHK